MTIDISQFYQVFFDEAEELLAEKERLLLAVDIAAPDPEDLNAIFRTAHSIKGGASTFGLNDMSEVTHVLESLLDRIRKGEMALTASTWTPSWPPRTSSRCSSTATATAPSRPGSGRQRAHDAARPVRRRGAGAPADRAVLPARRTEAADRRARTATRSSCRPRQARRRMRWSTNSACWAACRSRRSKAGRSALIIMTHESLDDIVAICSFVLDPDDLKIFEAPPLTPEQRAIEAAERARIEDEQGYGFFDPADPATAPGRNSPTTNAATASSSRSNRSAAKPASGRSAGPRSVRRPEPLEVTSKWPPKRRPPRKPTARAGRIVLDPRLDREGRPADQPDRRTGDHPGDDRAAQRGPRSDGCTSACWRRCRS
jgi:two-component system chemotaxis sensor kinase CheA